MQSLRIEIDRLTVALLEANKLACIDELTKVKNRRAFDSEITRSAAIAVRSRSPLTIVGLDLDNFKQVNDQFGHAGGDAVLAHFAEVVGRTIRPSDVLYRTGGEEFVLVLAQTSATMAALVTERLRVRLAKEPILLGRKFYSIEFSAGVAEFDFDEVARAVESADRALYYAKRQGKGRTCLINDLEALAA